MTLYQDIGGPDGIDEDKRIELIGHYAMEHKKTVGFLVDAEGVDGYEKADRYIRKLQEKWPGIRIIDKMPGPVANVITVRIGPPVD